MSEDQGDTQFQVAPRIEVEAITPNGFPIRITFSADKVSKLLGHMKTLTASLQENGYRAPDASAAPAATAGPPGKMWGGETYMGMPCSPTFDVLGYPEWIQGPDESIHTRKEEKGDVWFSYDTGETKADGKKIYERLFTVKKGETPPHEREEAK